MEHLQAADLCAQLDTMKHLCDQLQRLQADRDQSHALVERIQREADALRDTICGMHAKKTQDA